MRFLSSKMHIINKRMVVDAGKHSCLHQVAHQEEENKQEIFA